MYICAGNGEKFAFAKNIGVGLVNSAINLTSLILKENPSVLIFIGSAGAYNKNINVLDIFVSDVATQVEMSLLQGQSYTPLDNRIESNSLDSLYVSCETMQKSIVNSSNYITTDMNLANKMASVGIWLENMEFFSVMRVAEHFGIYCFGIFCVSNYCDENAHKDFIANHNDVKNRLNDFVPKLDKSWSKYV